MDGINSVHWRVRLLPSMPLFLLPLNSICEVSMLSFGWFPCPHCNLHQFSASKRLCDLLKHIFPRVAGADMTASGIL